MSDSLKITRIFLSGPTPFRKCLIDLSDLESSEPLNEICITGPNGTGKAMLLRQLRASAEFRSPRLDTDAWTDSLVVTEFHHQGRRVFQARPGVFDEEAGSAVLWLHDSFENEDWKSLNFFEVRERFGFLQVSEDERPVLQDSMAFGSEVESAASREADALGNFLAGIGRSRDEEFSRSLRLPENREKTVAEIETEFNESQQDLFQLLGAFWSKSVPGLAEELATDGDFMSKLARFEPGIRSLLLRTGKLLREQGEEGVNFLFLDGPENGLDPATALQAVDIYRAALGSDEAQIFTVTDSPLVATEFEPTNRIRLEKEEDGALSAVRGEAPKSASLTEILERDFKLETVVEGEVDASTPENKPEAEPVEPEEQDEDELADLIEQASWGRKR